MNYSEFDEMFKDKTILLSEKYPLSMFILDHYFRLKFIDKLSPIYQHIDYLAQVVLFGKIVDLYSKFTSSSCNYVNDKKIIISNTLIHTHRSMFSDYLMNNHGYMNFYFGLAKYNRQIAKLGVPYFPLINHLFTYDWSIQVRRALKKLLRHDDLSVSIDFSELERSTSNLVSGLSAFLVASNVQHVLALRDFFWYEAALILACRTAGTRYHVVAHGYPHLDPEQSDAIGFLPFRGDFLYCLHDDSRNMLSPYIKPERCFTVKTPPARTTSGGSKILFISSDVEEAGTFDNSFRLRIYRELRQAATQSGCRVVVRFREDEDLAVKIPQARSFGFHAKVKTDCPLEQDLESACIVFGFQSTALFLSCEYGCPTFQTMKYGFDIPGVLQVEPEMIPQLVIDRNDFAGHTDINKGLRFSDVFYSNISRLSPGGLIC